MGEEVPMNLSEETKSLISSLPSTVDFQGNKLCKYQGSWYYDHTLQAILNFQRGFKAQDSDIIIATYPKCGTTWIKALSIALLERSKHYPSSSDDDDHPLRSDNPHGIVPVLEIDLYTQSPTPDLTKLSSSSSPRLFSTHMSLVTLQEGIKDSSCKIVYVCRNIKDALVSAWHFRCSRQKIERTRSVLESMFESYCLGVTTNGPFWEHILGYWRGSLGNPKNILFLRYEELKAEPSTQLKRLAEFLGCPFNKAEEEMGLVEEVLELCSLPNLSAMEVNKTRRTSSGVDYKDFFRKGQVGDWKNHLTTEMEKRIDAIIEENCQSSGLKF